MHQGFDIRVVANYILNYGDVNDVEITNLKLQKLMYFCHAWYLATYDKPLVRKEFEAWEHGPVSAYIYREFKQFGNSKITSRASRIDKFTGRRVQINEKLPQNISNFLDEVLSFYSKMTASQLRNLSHEPGSPWHQVWSSKSKTNLGMKISDNSLKMFYIRSYPSN